MNNFLEIKGCDLILSLLVFSTHAFAETQCNVTQNANMFFEQCTDANGINWTKNTVVLGNKSYLYGSDRNSNEWWAIQEENKVSSTVTYFSVSKRLGTKSCLGLRCGVEFYANYSQFGVLDI